VELTNNYRFELVHLGEGYKKPFAATAYGDPLPRRGITAYGTTPWDALSNVAIGAANYEYRLLKTDAKRSTQAQKVGVQVETPRKRKGRN
jgi:hypothetical protein